MKLFSLSTLLAVVVALYLGNATWVFYQLWHPDSCQLPDQASFCIRSIIHEKPETTWSIKAYTSPTNSYSSTNSKRVLTWKNINFLQDATKILNITLPSNTLKNGSLFMHLFLFPTGNSAFNDPFSIKTTVALTDYAVPLTYMQLLKNNSETTNSNLATTHWRPKLNLHVLSEQITFHRQKLPAELFSLVRTTPDGMYLPMFYIDELSRQTNELKPIPKNATTMELTMDYQPISVGKLRLWLTLTQSMQAMKSLGFSDKDLDDMKGIFTGTSLFLLLLTFIVSFFHIIFDFLAFKNDINYWKMRENMVGLSIHSLLFRCVSTFIIFLYLMDQRTSLLVLIPAGIGSIIEMWKVKKALKFSFVRRGWRISFLIGASSDTEKATGDLDSQAIKYLSYVLYPLCIGAAVYSLFYVPHKSWYSWIIQSLVNAVYAFGFLFMLPQLFINYKLKSVAHLPWRAFMYKAFNTFIDDVFAFIVTMPTGHRLACFRDDIVFFCYLYQLWLYPVDKSRPNEYGVTYDEAKKKKD